mgnify:CR=1 FL=1
MFAGNFFLCIFGELSPGNERDGVRPGERRVVIGLAVGVGLRNFVVDDFFAGLLEPEKSFFGIMPLRMDD